MFTEQNRELQSIRNIDPSTKEGWQKIVDVLSGVFTNCAQPLTHRAPINIDTDGRRDGAADWPLVECHDTPDDGRSVRDVYAALTATNPASKYNESSGYIENGLAAKFVGVVCIDPLVTAPAANFIDLDATTIDATTINVTNINITGGGTGPACVTTLTVLTGVSIAVQNTDEILFTFSRSLVTFKEVGCPTITALGDVFYLVPICDICDGTGTGTGTDSCQDFSLAESLTASLVFTNCEECSDGDVTLTHVDMSEAGTNFIDPETDETVTVPEYWVALDETICGITVSLHFYCVPKPGFPGCQQMVLHVHDSATSYVVRPTSCDGQMWTYDISDFDCFSEAGNGTLQVTIT